MASQPSLLRSGRPLSGFTPIAVVGVVQIVGFLEHQVTTIETIRVPVLLTLSGLPSFES